MLSGSFELYYRETLALNRSLVIKVNEQNILINTYLTALGYTISADERTWKYNLNLAGQYHFIDEKMYIYSSDTQEEILFDRTVLLDHPRTKVKYAIGELEYNKLVAKHPNQELLIRGIIDGLDLDTVVSADTFTILSYNADYVAENEISLISKLQDWIDTFVHRWWNPDCGVSDPLYAGTFLGIMFHRIQEVIMNLRLEACHTQEVSQFHLWAYLGSYYGIDAYKDTLTITQALWLYRNITSIKNQMGTEGKIKELIEVIIQPAGLDISKIDFIQLDNTLLVNSNRTSAYSASEYESKEVNLASGSLMTPEILYAETSYCAAYNELEIDTDIDNIIKVGDSSSSNFLPTKILMANENASLYSQSVVSVARKVNHWAYMAFNGYYNADFSIAIPGIGSFVFDALDAFKLLIYAGNRFIGNDIQNVPKITVNGVIPLVLPTRDEIKQVVVSDDISDIAIDAFLDSAISLPVCHNSTEFEVFIDSLTNQTAIHSLQEEFYRHPDKRSQMRDVANTLSTIVQLPFEEESYSTWLVERGIDTENISITDWGETIDELLATVVNYTNTDTSFGLRQTAMLNLLDQLTSYEIMLLRGEGSNKTIVMDSPTMLIFDITSGGEITDTLKSGIKILDSSLGNGSGSETGEIETGITVEAGIAETTTFLIETGESITAELNDNYYCEITTGATVANLISINTID